MPRSGSQRTAVSTMRSRARSGLSFISPFYAVMHNYVHLHNSRYCPTAMHSNTPGTLPVRLTRLDLSQFQTLAFAGGGNRCWWQGGAVSWLQSQGFRLPAELVGTSAGAGVAAALITGRAQRAMQACQQLYAGNASMFDLAALKRLRLRFGHAHIYPAWVASYVNVETFDALRSAPTRLRVAITQPARWLGVAGSVLAGTLAYLVDKHVAHTIHPRLPRWLGLRQAFFDLQDCTTVQSAQTLLYAAATAPPFMPVRAWQGMAALDGGFTDNAPIHAQTPAEKAATLVLLTRHYPRLPQLFRWRERTYWQPSAPVPVSTWDCTPRTTVQAAWALGEHDAQQIMV